MPHALDDWPLNDEGISTVRTCEIGLSQHGGIDYHGLVYFVDRVTQA